MCWCRHNIKLTVETFVSPVQHDSDHSVCFNIVQSYIVDSGIIQLHYFYEMKHEIKLLWLISVTFRTRGDSSNSVQVQPWLDFWVACIARRTTRCVWCLKEAVTHLIILWLMYKDNSVNLTKKWSDRFQRMVIYESTSTPHLDIMHQYDREDTFEHILKQIIKPYWVVCYSCSDITDISLINKNKFQSLSTIKTLSSLLHTRQKYTIIITVQHLPINPFPDAFSLSHPCLHNESVGMVTVA